MYTLDFVGLYEACITVVPRYRTGHEVHLSAPGSLWPFSRSRSVLAGLVMFACAMFVILVAVKPFEKGLEVFASGWVSSSFS